VGQVANLPGERQVGNLPHEFAAIEVTPDGITQNQAHGFEEWRNGPKTDGGQTAARTAPPGEVLLQAMQDNPAPG